MLVGEFDGEDIHRGGIEIGDGCHIFLKEFTFLEKAGSLPDGRVVIFEKCDVVGDHGNIID